MGRGSVDQIGNTVANEIKGAFKDLEHSMQRMEQHVKNAAKVVDTVAGGISGSWKSGSCERSRT